MAQCSNCYNGCTEIVSDKCVKYTGVDVAVLGIKNGDSLSYVEQALITFLTSTLDGTGIKLTIDPGIICTLVSQYLQECDDLTAIELFKALIQAACDLQEQIDVIEANYTVDCLSGVTATSGTHAIVQAVITKLCSVEDTLTALQATVAALATDVDTNYVKLADLDSLIQAYLDSIATGTQYYTKMVPYTMVAYFGSLSNFDATGAGLGDWQQIYLCNGLNGTPDMRGRVPVGAISGVPGGALSSTVNPASDPTFNPNYAVGDTAYGVNKVTLVESQIPSHTHSITDPEHTHILAAAQTSSDVPLAANDYIVREGIAGTDSQYALAAATVDPTVGKVLESSTGITGTNNTGGGGAHDNKQPSLAAYWIMYIPN